jgi:site-specific DNA recombinase
MLDDLRAGRRDALVVYNTDRLTRQPRELEDIIDLLRSTASGSWRRARAILT